MANQQGGTKSAGKKFMTDIFLISRMDKPDARMRKPPTMDTSHISSGVR